MNKLSTEISREYFANTWYIYQLCLFTFFMYETSEFEVPVSFGDASIYQFLRPILTPGIKASFSIGLLII